MKQCFGCHLSKLVAREEGVTNKGDLADSLGLVSLGVVAELDHNYQLAILEKSDSRSMHSPTLPWPTAA